MFVLHTFHYRFLSSRLTSLCPIIVNNYCNRRKSTTKTIHYDKKWKKLYLNNVWTIHISFHTYRISHYFWIRLYSRKRYPQLFKSNCILIRPPFGILRDSSWIMLVPEWNAVGLRSYSDQSYATTTSVYYY